MKQISVYNIIKKQNGEHFAKAIRNYNNGIFEIPDIINIVKYAGTEAEPIMNYLVSLMDIQISETEYEDPFALLKKAGYNAYYADTLEKQNAISKYFEEDERLCTFRDNTRFENYYIINAVKENVDDIKRKNFTEPKREDEYATSVISIQMLKNGGFISIKNRYNHKVANPDNTFNSNPDNIIYGLSYSLKKYFDVDFTSQKINLTDNYIVINNKIIKYNYEINGYYVGDGFYVKDGNITEINKQTEIMIDHHILNIKDKTVTSFMDDIDNYKYESEVFQDELKDKSIQIVKNDDKTKSILLDGKEFANIKNSQITKLTLEKATEIGDKFLWQNTELKELNMPKVKKIGNYFLYNNKELKKLNLPEVKTIRDNFLVGNKKITSIKLPKVLYIEENFLFGNNMLKSINLPAVKKISFGFLDNNKVLKKINVPNLTEIPMTSPLIFGLIKKSLEKKNESEILGQTTDNSR